MSARKDRPEGIRHCSICKEDALCGAGQSACRECRATRARVARAEFNHGVEKMKQIIGKG